jgi:hypothetical protein
VQNFGTESAHWMPKPKISHSLASYDTLSGWWKSCFLKKKKKKSPSPASMALLLGSNFCNYFIFWTPEKKSKTQQVTIKNRMISPFKNNFKPKKL